MLVVGRPPGSDTCCGDASRRRHFVRLGCFPEIGARPVGGRVTAVTAVSVGSVATVMHRGGCNTATDWRPRHVRSSVSCDRFRMSGRLRALPHLATCLVVVGLLGGLTTSCSGFRNVGCSHAQEGPTPVVSLSTTRGSIRELPLSRSFVVLVPRSRGFGRVSSSNGNVETLGSPQVAFDNIQYGFVTKYVGSAVLSAVQQSDGKKLLWSARISIPCHGAPG